MNLQNLKKHGEAVTRALEKLDVARAKGTWNEAMQKERDTLAEYCPVVERIIGEKMREVEKEPEKEPENKPVEKYAPAPGTEAMVHLRIVRGNKFDPNTGKRLSKPYTQIFSYAEWLVFKANFKALGFGVEEVLHDPYGEAAAFVTVKE